MLALVTGVAGFIGSHLAERLVGDGWFVRGVDSFTPYDGGARKEANLDALRRRGDVELHPLDLRTDPLAALLDGVDVVFHFAAQPGVRPSWDDFATYSAQNIDVTHRLLEEVRGTGLRRLVFASSSSVYGQIGVRVTEDAPTRPFSPYGVTKLAAESLCRAYAENFAVPAVVLRLFTVYGPRQRPDMALHRLIRSAVGGEPFTVFGDGSQSRALTYVDDVVDAVVRAATAEVAPGDVFNVAGEDSSSLKELVELVEQHAGAAPRIVYDAERPGDVERTGAVIRRAADVLGWSPWTALETGVQRQVESQRPR